MYMYEVDPVYLYATLQPYCLCAIFLVKCCCIMKFDGIQNLTDEKHFVVQYNRITTRNMHICRLEL